MKTPTEKPFPHQQAGRHIHQFRHTVALYLIAGVVICVSIASCIRLFLITTAHPEIAARHPIEQAVNTPSPHVTAVPTHTPVTPTLVTASIPMNSVAISLLLPPLDVSLLSPTRTITSPSETVMPFPKEEILAILNDVPGTFGVLVYDEETDRQLYEQNGNMSFYAASLIKLPIALTLYSMADQGDIDLNEQLVLQEQDKVPGTGLLLYDPVGTTYTLRELCAKMISTSDNTASNMLLTRIGFDQVNTLMRQLGANRTYVERLFFDEAARLAGRDIRTSPHDMALLLKMLLYGEIVCEEGTRELLTAMEQNVDRQKIPAFLPPDAIVMNKSGVVEGSEHDAAIVSMPNDRRYIVVIMSTDLVDNATGIQAIAETSRLIFNYEQELGL